MAEHDVGLRPFFDWYDEWLAKAINKTLFEPPGEFSGMGLKYVPIAAAVNDDDIIFRPLSKTPKVKAVLTPTTWHCPCGKTVLYNIKYCPNCGKPGLFGA